MTPKQLFSRGWAGLIHCHVCQSADDTCDLGLPAVWRAGISCRAARTCINPVGGCELYTWHQPQLQVIAGPEPNHWVQLEPLLTGLFVCSLPEIMSQYQIDLQVACSSCCFLCHNIALFYLMTTIAKTNFRWSLNGGEIFKEAMTVVIECQLVIKKKIQTGYWCLCDIQTRWRKTVWGTSCRMSPAFSSLPHSNLI